MSEYGRYAKHPDGGTAGANEVDMPGGHSVAAGDAASASSALAKNESWEHVLEKSGSFEYYIKEYPEAKGVVHVK